MRHRSRNQNAPLRVLVVVPYDLSEPGGGVKHHAVSLARVLRELGDEVTVAGPASQPIREPHMVGFRGVVNIQFNGSANRIGIFVNPWAVRRFLRKNEFDVIHVHDPLVPGLTYWVSWLAKNVPKVCTFHAFAEEPSLGMRVGHRAIASWILPHYQRGIAVSRPAESLVRPIWGRPLSIIPNGVLADVFTPSNDLDVAHPVDAAHPLRLFFCARLSDERKGFSDLLRAYSILRERQIPVTLDVVGEAAGPLPPELPGLTYHGPVPLRKLVERFQACDVLVAPSTGQESFGIVLLEGMATGRAIVCSDIDGYRQVVDPQGAFLCPSRSPESLATAITILAENPEHRRSMMRTNRKRALSFDWVRLVDQVRAQYLLAMGSQPEESLQVALSLLPQALDRALPAFATRTSTALVRANPERDARSAARTGVQSAG
jgi:phosphatidylinositol alpha-mannosyltransferase